MIGNTVFTSQYNEVQYLHTYLLTPWSRVIEKLTDFQLVKKFSAF